MKAVDTNVLARALIRDDARQATIADMVLDAGAFVSLTVLLETAWLLASRYKVARSALADTLADILDFPHVAVEESEAVRWAIDCYREGADIADAIHVAAGVQAECFATFNGDMRKRLVGSPIPIEILS